MTSLQSFEPAAGFVYTHSIQNMNDENRATWTGRFAEIATDAGIEARIHSHEKQILVNFDNQADYLVFQNIASDRASIDRFLQTFQFLPTATDEYRNAWVYSTREVLQDAGIPHRVEDRDGEVDFYFQSFGGRAMFESLLDTGYFDKRADALLRIEGPPPPGALPY
jgi:hypothetical protein